MKRQHPSQASHRSGVILLVVLGALTFFSVLVATYLVFANDSRDASVALSRQSARAPDVNWMMNEALMTLVRGTGDPNNPFFGEDLLSDYYGHDGLAMRVHYVNAFEDGPLYYQNNSLARFPISRNGTARQTGIPPVNDVFAGRLVTFIEGPLQNRTFRVLRSIYKAAGAAPEHDDLFIELTPTDLAPGAAPNAVRQLFYQNATNLTANSYRLRMNGAPRNSLGIGYNAATNAVDQTINSSLQLAQPRNPNLPATPPAPPPPTVPNPPVGLNLPVALQPNHIGPHVDKSLLLTTGDGDFDEDYDAADFNNWWLSHRRADGTVIPSFHRPAVLNYILNEQPDWSAASQANVQDLIASFARATFRPFPIGQGQMGGTGAATFNPAINDRFTGGSNEYALRIPLRYYDNTGNVNAALLNQLARALINGTYDVDNDADGYADSVWINLGLPLFTSREGKLLRPLVAPMIEDMSARLNLNAHSNSVLVGAPPPMASLWNGFTAGLNSPQAFWAGTTGAAGTAANDAFVFRGLGWGPADIGLPLPLTDFNGNNLTVAQRTTLETNLVDWINERYRFGEQTLASPDLPGRADRDLLDDLRFGGRPPYHQANFGFGRSTDPFGRGGSAMGRTGNIVVAGSGITINNAPVINEAVNNPYESDPSGELGGDRAALLADLEVLLRNNDFDSELLPQPLRERLQALINFRPEYGRSFTTMSASDDSPSSASAESTVSVAAAVQTPHLAFLDLLNRIHFANTGTANSYTQYQWGELVPPELRLGRKLDVNRPFGNGLDDNNNQVVDEPLEVTRRLDGMDDDGNGVVDDESTLLTGEANAFLTGQVVANVLTRVTGNIPANYFNRRPNYTFDDQPPTADPDGPTNPPGGQQWIPVSGRQLLARHLYLLMMALSRDLETAGDTQFPSITNAMPPPASFDPDLYKARRLAQWAVNVIDYRDSDSINTRFVYDPTPFDATGWSPPQETAGPQQANGFHAPGGTQAPQANVVWGVEAPQLVFSESAAYHDVRLRDTNRDDNEQETKGGGPMDDDDSDQVRMPQGSLFLELYCPHPVISGDQQTQPGAPQELYDTVPATGVSGLDLDRVAPGGALVWRIAISQRHDTASPEAALDPFTARTDTPDSYSFQPEYPDELGLAPPGAGATLQYDRFILFIDVPTPINDPSVMNVLNDLDAVVGPIADMTREQVFYAPAIAGRNGLKTLQCGQFLTLAPRLETRFGSKEDGMAPAGLVPSDQRFEMRPLGLVQYDQASGLLTPNLNVNSPAPFTPALPLLIAAPRPETWGLANSSLVNNVVGVNVSEPLPNAGAYYPQPTLQYDGGTANYPLYDAYVDLTDVANTAVDTPLDTDPTYGFGRLPDETPADPAVNEPVLGTLSRYCSAYLQRLADPTMPYHEQLNPYRTVDWMPIDLNVFSGEDRARNIMADPSLATYTRRTRQRNGQVVPPPDPTTGAARTAVAANALFSYETNDSEFGVGSGVPLNDSLPEYFLFGPAGGLPADQHLLSSFSFLNTAFANINPMFQGFDPSVGMSGAPNVVGNDRNLPRIPFAIHPWLNRPFASHFELMMVPACSQGRLFEEFSFDPTMEPTIYPVRPPPNNGIDQPGIFNSPYRHLLNFFHSNVLQASATTQSGAEFARLFDYVHTLPRFRGEVEFMDPQRLVPPPPPPPPGGTPVDQEKFAAMTEFRKLLEPPFNLRYDNQRQARVNLNTVSEFPVWAGLMQGHLNQPEFIRREGLSPAANQLSFNEFIENRRGYPTPLPLPPNPPPAPLPPTQYVTGAGPYNYDQRNLDPRFPTEFVGVFRSATTTPKALDLRVPANTDVIRRRPVNGTLLRGAGDLGESDSPGGTPTTTSMFVRAGAGVTSPPFAAQQPDTSAAVAHDRLRNPFMRYQTLMRMPNLAADNSQVFVIRLTLGFFEVDASTLNLKDEYNADIGQNERYQATFVIDRSIPVGFDPGEDLNARDIVIFESYAQ